MRLDANFSSMVLNDEEAVRKIRRKMERDIHIEYCRLVAEAKEKKRRQFNAASSPQHSATQSECVAAGRRGQRADCPETPAGLCWQEFGSLGNASKENESGRTLFPSTLREVKDPTGSSLALALSIFLF